MTIHLSLYCGNINGSSCLYSSNLIPSAQLLRRSSDLVNFPVYRISQTNHIVSIFERSFVRLNSCPMFLKFTVTATQSCLHRALWIIKGCAPPFHFLGSIPGSSFSLIPRITFIASLIDSTLKIYPETYHFLTIPLNNTWSNTPFPLIWTTTAFSLASLLPLLLGGSATAGSTHRNLGKM